MWDFLSPPEAGLYPDHGFVTFSQASLGSLPRRSRQPEIKSSAWDARYVPERSGLYLSLAGENGILLLLAGFT